VAKDARIDSSISHQQYGECDRKSISRSDDCAEAAETDSERATRKTNRRGTCDDSMVGTCTDLRQALQFSNTSVAARFALLHIGHHFKQ
jgi:hypothetical protein